ncbi:hypothetical protein KHHGKMAE_4135 [Methylobacterium persicinum]|nr:hypothetical protein KHHGKMAE_4135 [Methylobacterium persicinum]
MEAALDRGDWKDEFSPTAFSAPLPSREGERNALVPVPVPPPPPPPVPPAGRDRRRHLIPALLVVGWGGLFAYCAAYLREDLPFRPQSQAEAARRGEDPPRKVVVLPDLPVDPPPAAQKSGEDAPPSAAPAMVPVPPAVAALPASPSPRKVAPAVAEYVGTWGPTPAACLSPTRRRGYLPATITADRARAGRTICTFHDGHRTGNTWLMAAECSDRGRRWSSQVRLLVEGDRLTWTSSRGAATYVRCGRRAG